MSFFRCAQKILSVPAWFEHIAYTPLQMYLGKLDRVQAFHALANAMGYGLLVLLVLAQLMVGSLGTAHHHPWRLNADAGIVFPPAFSALLSRRRRIVPC